MNKLPLPNLPTSLEPVESYERRLNVKLNEILNAQRNLINKMVDTLPVYANNADAITGGLAVGDFYRTGGDPDIMCVVH